MLRHNGGITADELAVTPFEAFQEKPSQTRSQKSKPRQRNEADRRGHQHASKTITDSNATARKIRHLCRNPHALSISLA